MVQTLLLQRLLARRISGMRLGGLWHTIAKIILASATMAAVLALGWWGVREVMGGARTGDLIAILVLIPISTAVYGGVLWALRVEGRDELSVVIRKMLRRFGLAK